MKYDPSPAARRITLALLYNRTVRGGPAPVRVTKQVRPARPGTPCPADGRAATSPSWLARSSLLFGR